LSDVCGAGEALTPPAAVGFVGLGRMGRPMAARLVQARFTVKGFDAAPAAREAFESAAEVTAADSAEDACREVSAVITMLPNGQVVREVLCGSAAGGGALSAAAPGTIVIDMSSSSPIETRALAEALAPRGFAVVDAPVSGGVKRALDGSLAIMAGGGAEVVRRVTPLLAVLGGAIFATGPLGSGHAMKALNNFVSAAGLVAAAEAIIVGRRFGLDPEVIVDVLNASTGRNNSTEKKMKQQVLSGDFASGFALALMAKDLHTAADIARHAGVATPLAEVCEDLWARADATLGAGADHTEIYRYLLGLSAETENKT
jgi:3-hydroxyisobutyrate dehydrogenase